jgi:hypothetical protein
VIVIEQVNAESVDTVESQLPADSSPIPAATEPVANASTANAVPTPIDPTTAMLMMQQQTMMQQNLIQQQNLAQQQHVQSMERAANQDRAERAAAQERSDRQAGLERGNILAVQSAHSEASQAMHLSATTTTQALTADNVADTDHDDTLETIILPKEDDNRSASRTKDSVAPQLSALSLKQLRGAYTHLSKLCAI